MAGAFTKCPACGSDKIKKCGAVIGGSPSQDIPCSRKAHDETVLVRRPQSGLPWR